MAHSQADLSNWRTAPHNIWAFHNVSKILPTETVDVNPGEHAKLKTASETVSFTSLKAPKPGSQDGEMLDWPSLLSYTNTDGIVVLKKGQIVYEHYANGNIAESKHIIFSMTKSITGLIAGILSDKGLFDLKAPIKQYVPSASAIWDGATVQQCLDMQTGIIYDDNAHAYRAASGWEPFDRSERAKTLHAFLEQVNAEVDEGMGFHYASVNTDLIGWALENATGQKLAQLISTHLWQPLGASTPADLTVDSEGSARAAGGLCATVRDLALLGQLLADGGRDIVPTSWIDDMLHGGDHEKWARSPFAPAFSAAFKKAAYRDFWIADSETGILCALGIFGQALLVDTKRDVVVAKTSSSELGQDFGRVKVIVEAFVEEIRRILE